MVVTDNLNVEFLTRLWKIDKSGLTARDLMLLYTIMTHPGISGLEAANLVGVRARSSVQFSYARLMKREMIEDRRVQESKGVPNRLFILPAGLEFWNQMKF